MKITNLPPLMKMVLLEKEYDFQKTCRTCLGENSEMCCMFDMALSTNDSVSLTDFFRKLTSLKVYFLFLKFDVASKQLFVGCRR